VPGDAYNVYAVTFAGDVVEVGGAAA